jgi:hypothetical protein
MGPDLLFVVARQHQQDMQAAAEIRRGCRAGWLARWRAARAGRVTHERPWLSARRVGGLRPRQRRLLAPRSPSGGGSLLAERGMGATEI